MNNLEIIEKQKEKINSIKKKAISVRNPQAQIMQKILVKDVAWKPKQSRDKKGILELINEIPLGCRMKIVSNLFDSPNIISAINSKYEIKEAFVSSWAVTPIGIARLKSLTDKGVKITLLLDKTHSYKWLFSSGAYKVLKNASVVFSENHSKFILFDLGENIAPINFIGSFNLSNNPRYENIEINRSFEEYKFYSNFVKSVEDGSNESQYTLF